MNIMRAVILCGLLLPSLAISDPRALHQLTEPISTGVYIWLGYELEAPVYYATEPDWSQYYIVDRDGQPHPLALQPKAPPQEPCEESDFVPGLCDSVLSAERARIIALAQAVYDSMVTTGYSGSQAAEEAGRVFGQFTESVDSFQVDTESIVVRWRGWQLNHSISLKPTVTVTDEQRVRSIIEPEAARLRQGDMIIRDIGEFKLVSASRIPLIRAEIEKIGRGESSSIITPLKNPNIFASLRKTRTRADLLRQYRTR